MKLVLLGATGRTGKRILEEALKRDYEVCCLVRNSDQLKTAHPKLQICTGSPSNAEDLSQAMNGADALISALNISRTSDFPWAPLRTPETFLSDVMKLVITHAKVHPNLRRVVVCSAWGVGDTRKDIPGWFRWFIDHTKIGIAYRDHERQEALLMESGLEWTIVRPSGLTNSEKPEQVIVSENNTPRPGLTISRRSVAKYMVEALEAQELIGKLPVISSK